MRTGQPKESGQNDESFWWRLINLDPAIYRGLIVAIVGALAAVGIILTPGLPDQLIGLVAALAAFAQAVWTRRGTTPNAKVVVMAPEPMRAPDVVLPGAAATTATNAEIIDAARYDGRA